MDDAIGAVCWVLCSVPDANILDVEPLFTNSRYRQQMLRHLDDIVARSFWQQYDELSEAAKRELYRPILVRLRKLYRFPAVRNIVCQTTGADPVTLIRNGSRLLFGLAGDEIAGEAPFLGELVITRLRLAAASQLQLAPAERKQWYLVIDESAWFQGGNLAPMAREVRKMGLGMIWINQQTASWSEEMQTAFGNISTKIMFRTDSHLLANDIRPFTTEQLETLNRYEAIIRLQSDGETVPAFLVKTLEVAGVRDEERIDRIRTNTRRQFGKPRAVVERDILDRYQAQQGSQPDERSRPKVVPFSADIPEWDDVS